MFNKLNILTKLNIKKGLLFSTLLLSQYNIVYNDNKYEMSLNAQNANKELKLILKTDQIITTEEARKSKTKAWRSVATWWPLVTRWLAGGGMTSTIFCKSSATPSPVLPDTLNMLSRSQPSKRTSSSLVRSTSA